MFDEEVAFGVDDEIGGPKAPEKLLS